MPPNNSQNPNTQSAPLGSVQSAIPPAVTVPHKPAPVAPLPAQTLQSPPVMPTSPQTSAPTTEPMKVPQSFGGQATTATISTPATEPPTAPVQEKNIDEQIAEKETLIKSLTEQRSAIIEASKKLFSEKHTIEEKLLPVVAEEKAIVLQIEDLEEKKATTKDPHAVRTYESARWEKEELRRGIEHSKWALRAEGEAVEAKIKDIEHEFKKLSEEEDACSASITELQKKKEQDALEHELEAVRALRVAREEEFARLRKAREELAAQLAGSVAHEKDIIDKEHLISRKEGTARTVYEEEVLAGERHKLEDERRDAEQKRWEAEDKIPDATETLEESASQLGDVKKKEAEIQAKLQSLGK